MENNTTNFRNLFFNCKIYHVYKCFWLKENKLIQKYKKNPVCLDNYENIFASYFRFMSETLPLKYSDIYQDSLVSRGGVRKIRKKFFFQFFDLSLNLTVNAWKAFCIKLGPALYKI